MRQQLTETGQQHEAAVAEAVAAAEAEVAALRQQLEAAQALQEQLAAGQAALQQQVEGMAAEHQQVRRLQLHHRQPFCRRVLRTSAPSPVRPG